MLLLVSVSLICFGLGGFVGVAVASVAAAARQDPLLGDREFVDAGTEPAGPGVATGETEVTKCIGRLAHSHDIPQEVL